MPGGDYDWVPRVDGLDAHFMAAGRQVENLTDMVAAVKAHTSVVFLKAAAGFDQVSQIATLVDAALAAGGLAVKNEAAGKAHSVESWQVLRSIDVEPAGLYALFVCFGIERPDGIQSCGMTQFGRPDTFVLGASFDDALDLAEAFNWYQLVESPTLDEGHMFSTTAEGQPWKMTHGSHLYQDDGDIDFGPGVWCLQPEPSTSPQPRKTRLWN